MDAFTICIAVAVIALLGFICSRRMEVVARRTVYEMEDNIYRKAREEASRAAYKTVQGTLQEVREQSGVLTRSTETVMAALEKSIKNFNKHGTDIYELQAKVEEKMEKTKQLMETGFAVKEALSNVESLKSLLQTWVLGLAGDRVRGLVAAKYRCSGSSYDGGW